MALDRADIGQAGPGQGHQGQADRPPDLGHHGHAGGGHQAGGGLDRADDRVLDRNQGTAAVARPHGVQRVGEGVEGHRLIPRAQVQTGLMAEGPRRALIGDPARSGVGPGRSVADHGQAAAERDWRPDFRRSATRKASSSAWSALRRGSQWVW